MVRKTAYIGFSYLIGLIIASFLSLWLSFAAGGLFLCAGICILIFLRPNKASRACKFSICSVAFAAGIIFYSAYDLAVCIPITRDSGKTLTAEAIVAECTSYQYGKSFYTVLCRLPCGLTGRVGFYLDDCQAIAGDKITVTGTLYAPENDSFFSTADYYRSDNVFLLLSDAEAVDVHISEHNPFRAAKQIREKIISQIRRWVPSDEGELLIGTVFGNSHWRISDNAEKLLYKSGIGHVASVSGMHMAIAAGIVSAFTSAAGVSDKTRFIAVLTAAVTFAFAADFTVSVMRSLVMILIVYGAGIFMRQSDPLTSLAAAVITITLPSPFTARSISFLLSVSGVIGTAVFAPAVSNYVEKQLRRRTLNAYYKLNGAAASAISAVCASAAVFPASALSFDEISLISPVTNLLLGPLCTAAAGISMAGSVFCAFSLNAIGGGLFLAAGFISRFILMLSEFFGGLDFAAIPSGTEVSRPLIMLVIITCAAGIILTGDRFYSALTCIAAAAVSITMTLVYAAVPAKYSEVSVLTNGNGCIIIVKDNTCAAVYDFMGTEKGLAAAESCIARTGFVKAEMAVLSSDNASLCEMYEQTFPEAEILSPDLSCGLTYSAEDNIIKFGDIIYYPYEDYGILEINGARIICINRKSAPPHNDYDLAVYNCIADVSVDSPVYCITEKRFKGQVPPSAQCSWCETSHYYITENGKIIVKEDASWLR